MYAISRLIFNKMDEMNVSMFELVQRLGFSDIDRGLKEIGYILKNGEYNEVIMSEIIKILNTTEEEVKDAYVKTVKQKNNDNIMKFKQKNEMVVTKSSLFVKLKKRKSDKDKKFYKRIAVPDSLMDLEWIEQVREVKNMSIRHYSTNYKKALSHGYSIVGYIFYKYKDGKVYEKLYFNNAGILKKVSTPDFPKVISALAVNREKNRLSLA